jgi:hypothetical protein
MVLRTVSFFIFLIAGLQHNLYSQVRPTEKFEKWEKTLVFSLVMGDHFENDSADIFIDGTAFFRNVKLTSSRSDGCADVIINIHKNEAGEYRVAIFRGDSVDVKPLPDLINVKLVFNGKLFEYIINPKSGKYALFEKEAAGLLTFRQTNRQPTFE